MRIASIIVAAFLQLMPVCRVALVSQAAAPPAWAWIMTWAAAVATLMGGYDSVSGASVGISGLTKYSGTTPVGTPTFDVLEPMGQSFRYRISVSNPGSDFEKNYFNCTPLPAGLSINTNVGAAGYITGIPLESGTFTVTLLAGNLNHPTPVTAEATITIYLPNAPPVFTSQPQDQSVLRGSNALLRAAVTGTPPLFYEWMRNGTGMPGFVTDSVSLTNVQDADVANYQLVVSNAFGVTTSAVARVTIRELLEVRLSLASSAVSNGTFHAQVSGPVRTNYVVWGSSDLQAWVPVATNWVVDGLLRFHDPAISSEPRRFYRASVGP